MPDQPPKESPYTTGEALARRLLDNDGSCRDINFSEDISTVDAASLLDFITGHWELRQATDFNGESLQSAGLRAFLFNEAGAMRTVWSGDYVLRDLQVYFYWPAPDRVFCELTFFPEALDLQRFTFDDFLRLLAQLVRTARSSEYYVRVEDAAWSHRNKTPHSVIFSHETVTLPLL